MSSQSPSFLQQFRDFYAENKPESLEQAIEYFAVFGGLGWKVDLSLPLMELIEEVVLDNYDHLHRDIVNVTMGDRVYHALLSGIAMGDGRTHSAFKRARLTEETGNPAIRYLCQNGIITQESPFKITEPKETEEHPVSDKLLFTSPFLRFWFTFVSPLFKGIQAGDYTEVQERFANRGQGLVNPVFEKLAVELLKMSFEDDPIVETGSYWDKEVEIAIVAKTRSGKIIAGECKYTNAKLKKSELNKLREKCSLAGFEPDICVLFSKRGFSAELKALKGEDLRLFSVRNFRKLVERV